MGQDNRMVFRSKVSSGVDATLPEIAVYVIDEEAALQIVNLAKLVKEHGLFKVEKFDYRVTYYKNDKESLRIEDEVSLGSDTLNVSADDFWFAGFLKHTNIEVLTEPVSIKNLVEQFGLTVVSDNFAADLDAAAAPGM